MSIRKEQAQQAKKRDFKFYVNIVTVVLVLLLLWTSREDLLRSWDLLRHANLWWLLLLLPLQAVVYYSASEIGLSYLERRKQIPHLPWWRKVIFSLELNFVNHVVPVAGVGTITYAVWRTKQFGADKTAAAMSSFIRAVFSFAAFVPLLIVASIWISFRNQADGVMVMLAVGTSVALTLICLFGSYIISTTRHMMSFGRWIARIVNQVAKKGSFGRIKHNLLDVDHYEKLFADFNHDYQLLMRDKQALKWPFIWGMVWILVDIAMFEATFLALGHWVDPMALLLAYGGAVVASYVVFTPGGLGAYEATFILILVGNGVDASVASAGTLLTRVILVVTTLVSGYYFYHKALNHHERQPKDLARRTPANKR